jgi:hypothetical protein
LDLAAGLPAGVAVEDALDAGELRDAIAHAPAASGAPHPDATLRLLERGVGMLPREPWLRYDLAQAYLDLHLPALARQAMQEGQDLAPDSASMHYAAALVDAALDQEDAALTRLDAIPASAQTEGMRSLAQRMRFERDLRMARLARAQDQPGEDAHWRALALTEAGEDPGRLLRVARADLSADDVAAARALLDELRDPERALDADDRRSLARLLVDAGEPGAALEQADILAIDASSSVIVTLGVASGTSRAATAPATDALAQSQLLRARAHVALHDAAAARADWSALDALLPPGEVPFHVEAIEQMDRDRESAHAWMSELRARHPQDARVLLEAGLQARRDEQYGQAAQLLREVGAAPAPDAAGGAAPPAAPVPLLAAHAATDGKAERKADGQAQGQAVAQAPAAIPEAGGDRADWTYALGGFALGAGEGSAAADPGQRAALELADIEARRQPRIETAWLYYSRSADDGISTIRGTEIPVVVSWPGGYDGHWFAQVDSVHAGAGTLAAPLSASAQFGQVYALPPVPTGLLAPIDEQAQGYSLAGGWRSDNRRVDLGVVGIGFKQRSVVGGWRENRTWDDTDVTAEITRRVATSSLLAYTGVVDPSSGTTWGGVTDTALSLRAGRDLGERWSASASFSLGLVSGRNVQNNPNQEMRLALDRDWVRRSDFRLSAGPSLSAWHYEYDAGFYTFGQGGYYSPQRYLAIGLPIEVEGRHGAWSYDARLVPGRSWTYEQNAPYYPTDGALQARAGNPIDTGGPGGGPSASVWADLEYRAAPHWTVGAWLDIDRSAYYAPTRVMLYLRYWFKPQEGAVPFPPHPVVPISLY